MAEESESVRVNSAAKKSGAETGSADDGIGRFSGKFSAMRSSFQRSDRGAETVGGGEISEKRNVFFFALEFSSETLSPNEEP